MKRRMKKRRDFGVGEGRLTRKKREVAERDRGKDHL